jgi:hypothetical protein
VSPLAGQRKQQAASEGSSWPTVTATVEQLMARAEAGTLTVRSSGVWQRCLCVRACMVRAVVCGLTLSRSVGRRSNSPTLKSAPRSVCLPVRERDEANAGFTALSDVPVRCVHTCRLDSIDQDGHSTAPIPRWWFRAIESSTRWFAALAR